MLEESNVVDAEAGLIDTEAGMGDAGVAPKNIILNEALELKPMPLDLSPFESIAGKAEPKAGKAGSDGKSAW